MNQPFSIVIPVYNRASMVLPTLESIKSQNYRPLHLILVDNNSTDKTPEVLHNWAGDNGDNGLKITIAHQSQLGAAAARNKGLELVDSELMLFFDSDDLLLPDAVEAYVRAFENDPTVELVMSRSQTYNSLTHKRQLLPLRGGDRLAAHIHHATLRTQGYAAKTELFKRVGGWNSDTLIWDDWELGIRLLLATDKIAQIQDVTNEIIIGHDSITGLKYSDRAGLYEVPIAAAERALQAHPHEASLMQYRRMMLAALFAREGDIQDAVKLKSEVLANTRSYPLRKRLLLRLAYQYIRRGGRGFDRILSLLY